MKIGDKVICIVNGQWRHADGPLKGTPTEGPKYLEELIIDYMDPDGWLGFNKYKKDESDTWDPTAFVRPFGYDICAAIEEEMVEIEEFIEKTKELKNA